MVRMYVRTTKLRGSEPWETLLERRHERQYAAIAGANESHKFIWGMELCGEVRMDDQLLIGGQESRTVVHDRSSKHCARRSCLKGM
jgi:hypothetical protein